MRFDLDDCYALLPRVSRTFALNIRILPGELKPSVTVAYLLFRLADTFEDCPGVEPEEKGAWFETFLERLDGRGPLELPSGSSRRLLSAVPPGEAELVQASEEIFRVFESLPDQVRKIVATHAAETASGMDRIVRQRTRDGMLQLQTWQDLDEYCYYVAGTIGIMLTRLFALHSRHIDPASSKRLTALGTNFGRGLQLTNILKGISIDREEGRVYLPASALAEQGLTPEHVLDGGRRAALLTVVDEVISRALQDLEDALRYTILLPRREPRLRLFCLWPLFTAVRTLGLVAKGKGIGQPGVQPKIGRGVLYREMAMSAAQVFSNGGLRRRFERFRTDLFPARDRSEVWAG
jgi:farnesyl-diphosphate farnesyltransferase